MTACDMEKVTIVLVFRVLSVLVRRAALRSSERSRQLFGVKNNPFVQYLPPHQTAGKTMFAGDWGTLLDLYISRGLEDDSSRILARLFPNC